MDEGDLPDIGEMTGDVEFAKPPPLASSPVKEDNKENNSTSAAKTQSSSSWLIFSGAKVLFEDDDDNSSSLSLPSINAAENDDEAVLQLDGSSFLDEQEAFKTQEAATGVEHEVEENGSDGAVTKSSKKSKKSKKKKEKNKEKGKEKEKDDEAFDIPAGLGDTDEQVPSELPLEEKKSKRLSKKALEKMHSDAQRVMREAPIAIPIRRAEPLNLDDILKEVASVNPEVRKFLEKEDAKKEHKKTEPESTASETTPVVDLTGPSANQETSQPKTAVEPHNDDSDIELEIIDDDAPPPPAKPVAKAAASVNPGVAWLMERFKRHNVPGKQNNSMDEPSTASAHGAPRWNAVKDQLVGEMTALREKGLKDRIERYKMENDEELGGEAEEEPEAESEKGSGSEDDDSYTTISDDDEEGADEKKNKKNKKKKKNDKEDQPLMNVFLDREAMETGSEDEDYQPSEGHNENGASEDGSICSDDEKVRSGSEDDDDNDELDDDEIDEVDEVETSDEEEEILRSSSKKKPSKKHDKSKSQSQKKVNRVESDDEDGDDEASEKGNNDDDDELPDLVIEERPVDSVADKPSSLEKDTENPSCIVEPCSESASSVVMPPNMPHPNQLFNIYNEPSFNLGKNDNAFGKETEANDMDVLMGLCTGPFLPVNSQSKSPDEENISNDCEKILPSDVSSSKSSDSQEAAPTKKTKHVYGKASIIPVKKKDDETDSDEDEGAENDGGASEEGPALSAKVPRESKKKKKERLKRLREFIEDEAELSESDAEHGRVSADEDDNSSDDSYETDPEFEDEVLNKLSARQLKNQVESIHMKQVIDEDERDLLHLREAIIPDADLADAVGPRLRRFRWADAWRDMAGATSSQPEAAHADDDWLGLGSMDANAPAPVASLSSMWQKQRVERERWLQSHHEKQVEDSQATLILSQATESDSLTEKSGMDSQLVRFGLSAMRRSSGSFSMTSTETTIATSSTRRVSHGSMLSSLQQKELDKIAQTVAPSNGATKRRSIVAPGAGGADPTPDDFMTAPAFKPSRPSAGPFIVMSDDRASPGDGSSKKRKFDSASNSSFSSAMSSASKRGKQQQPSSVFDFL